MPVLLQINECLNLSTGKIVQQIGDLALKSGWKSWIAYSAREPDFYSSSSTIKVGCRISPYFHYVESKLFDREGLSSRSETNKLISQIENINPDVVHLHNIHDHWLNYKLLFEFLNQTDIQVVWTFHDCWAFTGHCFHFVTNNCMKWKTLCNKCPMQHESPNTLVDGSKRNYELKKHLFTECNNLTIVACSNWMAGLVSQSFLRDKQIRVIHNGVDLTIFKPLNEKKSDGGVRIIAVSNIWNKEKGLYDIFKLRRVLPKEYSIIIVGLTEQQQKSLPEGIIGVKRTHNVQELVQLYSSSDVFINLTYADTFPTVNLEALACGKPIITYQTGGSPEVIDEKTGLVIEQGNIDALKDAVCRIINNPYMSTECRKRAELLFDKEKCFLKYVDLYNELIKREQKIVFEECKKSCCNNDI